MTLANKYRPTAFTDVLQQSVTTEILNNLIATKSFKNALLFKGSAGSGKTTCARIFANQIDGEIFEIDCASHNGVADVKDIIENAKTPSLINEYKVFILDEAHTLTPQAWSAMLITLEENLPYSIFIFCTTDVSKIPNTIISRVQEFIFMPISSENVFKRLCFVCGEESIPLEEKALKTLSKASNGNLRQALTYLDKCLLYSDLSYEGVCRALNIVSDDIMNTIFTAYTAKNKSYLIDLIMDIYNNGYELHLFIRQFLDFCLDEGYFDIIPCLLKINNEIFYDDNPKNLIIANLICF